ncbi:MAG: hypothetical protein ABJX32_13955 [Tateyamaria sp.]|mgnify:FL=1|uniref:hypothetical protein n=1 Tax=Alphaproteobacteria TaxID=28211 RepID=UPI003298FBE1
MLVALKSLSLAEGSPEFRLSQFRDAFLALGSQTPDNLQTIGQIDIHGDEEKTGLATRYSKLFLLDIA